MSNKVFSVIMSGSITVMKGASPGALAVWVGSGVMQDWGSCCEASPLHQWQRQEVEGEQVQQNGCV